jgi:hypothetical protein
MSNKSVQLELFEDDKEADSFSTFPSILGIYMSRDPREAGRTVEVISKNYNNGSVMVKNQKTGRVTSVSVKNFYRIFSPVNAKKRQGFSNKPVPSTSLSDDLLKHIKICEYITRIINIINFLKPEMQGNSIFELISNGEYDQAIARYKRNKSGSEKLALFIDLVIEFRKFKKSCR